MRRWISLLLMLLPGMAGALTLSQIQTQIRRNVRDTSTDTTLQRYSNAVLLTYVNQAQKEVNNLTWCVQASTSITLAVGTTFYAMPDNYITALQVTWTKTSTGVTLELKERSERAVGQSYPDFERQPAGSPMEYFIRYPKDGTNNLEMAIMPTVSAANAGTMKIDYVAQPADLVSDSDVPFDGYLHLAPYHNTIVDEVTSELKLIEGKTAEAGAYNAMFQSDVQILNQKFGSRPNYNPGMVGGGPGK